MVLELSFEDFATELTARDMEKIAYYAPARVGGQVTAGNPGRELILFTRSSHSEEEIRSMLAEHGIELRRGAWIGEEAIALQSNFFDCHVAGVAYRADGRATGLWMEAFDHEPTQLDVLRQFSREFQEQGFGENLDFDAFMRAVEPTVVILSPEAVRNFAQKSAAILTGDEAAR